MDAFAEAALEFSQKSKDLKQTFSSIFETPNFKHIVLNNAVVIKVSKTSFSFFFVEIFQCHKTLFNFRF